jgi:DNA helicase-2/ATP-dependent DNA helicase PcrA
MVQSGADFISFNRTINLPKRGLGEATIERIRLGANEENMTILGYCEALVRGEPMQAEIKLSAKQKEGLHDYIRIIHELRQKHHEGSIKNIVVAAIEETNYLKYLEEDRESFADRKENLDELIAKAAEWEVTTEEPSLEAFLEELSLKSTLDEVEEGEDRLNIMTIHHAKGLEFTAAFLVGLEEDLFPHINSKNSLEQLEEERRLCYVGITRAKDFLYISHCQTRYMWGNLKAQRPSRFLKEIPPEFTEKYRRPDMGSQVGVVSRPRETVTLQPKPPPTPMQSFAVGDPVFHKEFGIGKIQDAYDGSMGLTYKIFFTKDKSVKTLVAKYASLSRL